MSSADAKVNLDDVFMMTVYSHCEGIEERPNLVFKLPVPLPPELAFMLAKDNKIAARSMWTCPESSCEETSWDQFDALAKKLCGPPREQVAGRMVVVVVPDND